MMNPKSHVRSLTAQYSVCVFFLTACQSYDPFPEEDVFRGAYARNFIRTFGEISETQDWDFSDYPASRFHADSTRAGINSNASIYLNDEYEVNSTLFNNLTDNTNSAERADRSFALELDEDDCFTIFPVYQSSSKNSGIKWSLQVMADQENLTSSYNAVGWPMGTNMYVKTTRDGSYVLIGDKTCNSWGVKSKYIARINNADGAKKYLYFNLKITGNIGSIYDKYAPIGTQQSSLDYQMKILDLPKPDNIGADDKTLFIACEAANFDPNNPYTGNYGKRYRSLILMLVGPSLPKVVWLDPAQERLSLDRTVSKRYMIEDMGSSSDFDFNDVVVDVSSKEKTPVVIQKETLAGSYKPIKTMVGLASVEAAQTTATVRYLCGTRPFQLTVGNHVFGEVTDPTNEMKTRRQLQKLAIDEATYFESPKNVIGWTPDVTEVVDGWLPDQNNISIKVWRSNTSGSSDGGWLVQFPKVGEVPFVMALPDNTPWNEEGVNFTAWKQYVPSVSF